VSPPEAAGWQASLTKKKVLSGFASFVTNETIQQFNNKQLNK
jgi:hypothetical protein